MQHNHLNCSVIKLHWTQSNDWVPLSLVIEHNRTKNLHESSIKFDFQTRLNQSNLIKHSKPTFKIDKLTKVMRNKCSGFIELASFFCSAVTRDAFPDPHVRNKQGGGLNRTVRLTVTLPSKDAVKLKNSLVKHNIHSVIEEVD